MSHYEKIQTLGNRIVSNLQTKGISANFNDGGLTLADKILNINQFDDGIILKSNKKTIQNGDSVKLSAILLKENEFFPSTPVEFYEPKARLFKYIGTDTATSESEWYGVDYLTITKDANGTSVTNGQSTDQFMLANKDGTSKSQWTDLADWSKGDILSFNINSITGTVYLYANETLTQLTDTGEQIVNITLDNSYIGLKLEPDAIIEFNDFIVIGDKITSVTTDTHGVATYDYVGCSSGIKQFQVKKDITLFYDEAIIGKKNSNCYYSYNGFNVYTDETGTYLSSTGLASYYQNSNGSINQFLNYKGKYCIEFDVVGYTGNPRVRLCDGTNTYDWLFTDNNVLTGSHIKLVYDNNSLIATVDTVEKNKITTSMVSDIAIALRIRAEDTLKYKNLKIYPVLNNVVFDQQGGIIKSEICEVIDCIYLDRMDSNTTLGDYYKSKFALAFDNDKFIATRSTDGDGYVDLRTADAEDYKNKTIRFSCDVDSDAPVRLRIYEVTESSTHQKTITDYVSNGTITTDAVTISNNAIKVFFRIMLEKLGTSDSCRLKNFKVYDDGGNNGG